MLTIRKKPTEAELVKAIQWTCNNIDEMKQFCKKVASSRKVRIIEDVDVVVIQGKDDFVKLSAFDYIVYIGEDNFKVLSQEQLLAQYDIINATWRQQNFSDARDIEAACVSCV